MNPQHLTVHESGVTPSSSVSSVETKTTLWISARSPTRRRADLRTNRLLSTSALRTACFGSQGRQSNRSGYSAASSSSVCPRSAISRSSCSGHPHAAKARRVTIGSRLSGVRVVAGRCPDRRADGGAIDCVVVLTITIICRRRRARLSIRAAPCVAVVRPIPGRHAIRLFVPKFGTACGKAYIAAVAASWVLPCSSVCAECERIEAMASFTIVSIALRPSSGVPHGVWPSRS